MLSKEDILKAEDLVKKTIDVAEWGGKVVLRTMTGADREKFEKIAAKGVEAMDNFRARFLAKILEGADGKLLFKAEEEILQLAEKSAVVIERLFNEGMKLNKMGAGEVEEAEKNSEAIQIEDSISG